ncbi:MAG: hypothetical protein OEZ06_12600 [Myxococcales bacterium]|nr:hypothetical protein [Myxococcales bacterium]
MTFLRWFVILGVLLNGCSGGDEGDTEGGANAAGSGAEDGLPASCQNGKLDFGEATIDCGGSKCAPCPVGSECRLGFDEDCVSNNCQWYLDEAADSLITRCVDPGCIVDGFTLVCSGGAGSGDGSDGASGAGCTRQLSGINSSYTEQIVPVVGDVPAMPAIPSAPLKMSDGSCALRTDCSSPSAFTLTLSGPDSWTASQANIGEFEWGFERGDDCQPIFEASMNPSTGAMFNIYQLWFLYRSGTRSVDFQNVSLMKGTMIVLSDGSLDSVGVPSFEAGVNFSYRP